MKNKVLLGISASLFLSGYLYAWERHEEDPHYVWFEGEDVAVMEEGIFANSNKGMLKLNVIEYDRLNDRYKVLCRCLEDPHLDSGEALSAPYEAGSQ